jgi:hypothetical protein
MFSSVAVDEAALLAALKAGEEWAFETMIRRYGGRLLAVARQALSILVRQQYAPSA